MQNLQKIQALKHGENCTISLNGLEDCGNAEVHRLHDTLFLFEIPQYGGEPMFFAAYGVHHAKAVLEQIKQWT